VFINWNESINFPMENSSHNAFLLYSNKFTERTKYKVTINQRFISSSQARQMGITGTDGLEELQSFETGILKVGLIRAKNVKADETTWGGKPKSDPLAMIKFKGTKDADAIEKETKYKGSTLDPRWQETFTMKINFPKMGAKPPLEVSVWDHDDINPNDLLGSVTIKFDPLLEKPCTWAINQYFDLKDPDPKAKTATQGQIYVRAYYVPDGTMDPNVRPIDVDTGSADDTDNIMGRL
jgi:hypothetical protein